MLERDAIVVKARKEKIKSFIIHHTWHEDSSTLTDHTYVCTLSVRAGRFAQGCVCPPPSRTASPRGGKHFHTQAGRRRLAANFTFL